jgi:hypothetical protein
VRGEQALLGSFAIDLLAMTFGMPRALFAALAVSVYHGGCGRNRGLVRVGGDQGDGSRR